MEIDHIYGVAENNEIVKKILQAAKCRQVRIDNRFWGEFITFMLTEVRDSHRSNGYRMALCCWCLLRRKGGGYISHRYVISLSKLTKSKERFWSDFLELAHQNNWRNDTHLKIPYLDIAHLEKEDEPAYQDYDASQSELSSISPEEQISLRSRPLSDRLSVLTCLSDSLN